jgi:hypothetical protein
LSASSFDSNVPSTRFASFLARWSVNQPLPLCDPLDPPETMLTFWNEPSPSRLSSTRVALARRS